MNTICRLYCGFLARPEARAEIICGFNSSRKQKHCQSLLTKRQSISDQWVIFRLSPSPFSFFLRVRGGGKEGEKGKIRHYAIQLQKDVS